MFDSANQFFPTPNNVIAQMFYELQENLIIEPYPLLDPSAGSGNILEFFRNKRMSDRLYAIEIDPELLFILHGKNFRVIGTDFLSYSEPLKFNSIVMNPPFNKGVQHVLKAWDILNDGGCLVALISSETINNPCYKERDNLVKLIELYGYFKNLGQCFKTADRTTDVDISLIVLNKPKAEVIEQFNVNNFSFDGTFKEKEFNPSVLAKSDAIADLVSRYQACEKILIERYENQKKIDFYLQGIDWGRGHVSQEAQRELSLKSGIDEQVLALKAKFWTTVIDKCGMAKKITDKFREKFYKFTTNYSSLSFTQENIQSLLMLFVENFSENMTQCIVDVFQEATRYCEKNTIYKEGWKTNKCYKLNKTIIIPYAVNTKFSIVSVDYSRRGFFEDLDRIMCYLSGQSIDNIDSIWTILHKACNNKDFGQWYESTFFKVKFFQKGTVHIQFKDLKLLDEFNIKAGQGKNWVGGEGY